MTSYVVFSSKMGKELEKTLVDLHDHFVNKTTKPINLVLLKKIMAEVKKENEFIEQAKQEARTFWSTNKGWWTFKAVTGVGYLAGIGSVVLSTINFLEQDNSEVDCVEALIPYVSAAQAGQVCSSNYTTDSVLFAGGLFTTGAMALVDYINKKKDDAEKKQDEIIGKIENKEQFASFENTINSLSAFMGKKDKKNLQECIAELKNNKDNYYVSKLGAPELTESYLMNHFPTTKNILTRLKKIADQPSDNPPLPATIQKRRAKRITTSTTHEIELITTEKTSRRRREGASSSPNDPVDEFERQWQSLERVAGTQLNNIYIDGQWIDRDAILKKFEDFPEKPVVDLNEETNADTVIDIQGDSLK